MKGRIGAWGCLCCGVVWLFWGCSRDPLGRCAISGSVNVDGVPLQVGNIAFQPLEGQPTASGAAVTEGMFSIPRESGLVPGRYRVVINAPMPAVGGKVPTAEAMPGEPPPPPLERIPPSWNTSSQHTINVRREGPFEFRFDIDTKAR